MAGEVLEMRQIGFLAADPEIREGGGKDPVCTIRVITNISWKDRQTEELRERSEGFPYETWGKDAQNLAQYARKGDEIYVEASPRNVSWGEGADKKYGVRNRITKWRLLRRKNPQGQGAQSEGFVPAGGGTDSFDDADVPF